MGSVFFASYLIGLRDGLEASLVVTILLTALARSQRRDGLAPLWAGVGAAVVAAATLGALLTYVATSLLDGVRLELFEAVTSQIAVAMVTWMIFWMRRSARTIKAELTGKRAQSHSPTHRSAAPVRIRPRPPTRAGQRQQWGRRAATRSNGGT